MELGKYEKVRMNDGKLHGRLEVYWSRKRNRFEAHTGEYDNEGNPIVLYGTEIVTVEPKKKKFVPTAENCKDELMFVMPPTRLMLITRDL